MGGRGGRWEVGGGVGDGELGGGSGKRTMGGEVCGNKKMKCFYHKSCKTNTHVKEGATNQYSPIKQNTNSLIRDNKSKIK